MKKQPEATAQTKKNLMEAFWQLYCVKRISSITVKEIVEKAGYNRGTFYQYFSNTFDILDQIEESVILNIKELSLPMGQEQLMPFPIEMLVKEYEMKGRYLTVLLGKQGDPAFQCRMKTSIRKDLKANVIAQGIKDDFKLDLTLEFIISAMIGAMNLYFSTENRPSIDFFISYVENLTKDGTMRTLDLLKAEDALITAEVVKPA
jgi:AcrR family transcriptional regulator